MNEQNQQPLHIQSAQETDRAEALPPKDQIEFAGRWLEHYGWKKEVAGEEDFHKACLAVLHYRKNWKNGLLLIGETGCGKTLLAKRLFENTKSSRHEEDMRDNRVWVDCSDIAEVNILATPEEVRQLNLATPFYGEDACYKPILFLDDLGLDSPISNFGSPISIVAQAIRRFHARWSEPRSPVAGPVEIGNHLVVTTNLGIDALNERYGSRILDRLLEMCAIVEFTGKSKRKATMLA